MENKILLVEDESSIRSFVKVGFEEVNIKYLKQRPGKKA